MFAVPHGIDIDHDGNIWVTDSGAGEAKGHQGFDRDGKFLEEWKQFGRPSGVHIDRIDVIYVADSQSDETRNPGFTRGIWVGSAKDGSVTTFIPHPDLDPKSIAAEGVVVDSRDNIFAAGNNAPVVKHTKP
jgi:sugar lactone lactonase YvrE